MTAPIGEWVEFNGPFSRGEYELEEGETIGFRQQMGDDAVGLLIELEDRAQYLIGEVNTNGGVCECCSAISRTEIVKRYMRVWQPPSGA